MDEIKNKIIYRIRKSLTNKISEFYIFGSYFSDSWNPDNSDIDIVCVDPSFEEFPYFENLRYVTNALSDLPYKFDLFIYTPVQFNDKIRNDSIFCMKIQKAMCYDEFY